MASLRAESEQLPERLHRLRCELHASIYDLSRRLEALSCRAQPPSGPDPSLLTEPSHRAPDALPGVAGCAGAVLRFWRAGDSSPAPAGPPYSVVLSVSAVQGAALRLAAAFPPARPGPGRWSFPPARPGPGRRTVPHSCGLGSGASARRCSRSCGRLGARRAGKEQQTSRAASLGPSPSGGSGMRACAALPRAQPKLYW